ncbi:MAG: NAD-dependent epimerase/dehydratase family protein, partial [Solirubrobacterales bacterium]
MSSPSKRHILVIGGAGYIGSVLCPALLDAGHRVRVLDSLLYDNSDSLATIAD